MTTSANMSKRSKTPAPSGAAEPSGAAKKSPDITKCRAYSLGAGSLAYCLSEHRAMCDYPLPFGIKHFCLHPQCMEIADRFKAGPPGSASVKII